eukprot:COSAG06_NODE_542_length_14469_cov_39.223591_13_plen_748_part_00
MGKRWRCCGHVPEMNPRRSASGLFVLPASLPDDHPLVVQPEPEPEPEPTLEALTRTLLDHASVRIGREVLLSKADLGKVGRSKSLCTETRAFIAGWADGQVDSWVNRLAHTDAKALLAWDVLTAAARAEKLRATQRFLSHGRCLAEGASVRPDGTAVPASASEEDVASLCLALMSASVAKGHGFVSGSVVVEDSGHKLLAALSTAPGAYERRETERGTRGGAVDARAVGSSHLVDMIRWTSLDGVVDTTDDTGPLKFPCERFPRGKRCLGVHDITTQYPIELEVCSICGGAPAPDYADRLLTEQAQRRAKTQVRSAYDVFAAAWEATRGDLPLRDADDGRGEHAAYAQSLAEEVLSRRLKEDRKLAEAAQRRNAAAEEWRGITPEERILYEHAATAAAADAEAGRGPAHSAEDVKALLRIRDTDAAAGVADWFVGKPGDPKPYMQFGYDFAERPLLSTVGGWVAPTLVFGKAPIYPGNDDGWAQATLIVWEIDFESGVTVDNQAAIALIQDVNPDRLRRPPSRGGDEPSLVATGAEEQLQLQSQAGEHEHEESQVNTLALDNALGVPQHVRYATEEQRLGEQQRWVPVGPCRSAEQRPRGDWVRALRDARAQYGLDPDRDAVAHAHELRAAVGAEVLRLEAELGAVASRDRDSTVVTSEQESLVDQLVAARQQLQASNDFLAQGCRCWSSHWQCHRAVKELEDWCTGRSEEGLVLARVLRRELLQSLALGDENRENEKAEDECPSNQ